MVDVRHDSMVQATPWPGIYAVQTRSAHHFPKHWHDAYGLGLMQDGAHRSASGRGEVEAHAGDVITSNPGEIHDGRPLGTATRHWRMLCIEPSAMEIAFEPASPSVANDSEFSRPVIRDAHARRAVRQLFRRLERWNAQPDRDSTLVTAIEEALIAACSLVLHRHRSADPAPGSPMEGLARLRECLLDDLVHPPSLAEMAAMLDLSKFQLIRRFERAYGLPPHAWLLHRRAERARDLIRAGSGLSRAAVQCGFADQSHMTRVFGQRFGYTPGAWRRATRGMQ
jgi:AraC-like DNA-binding protein